MLATVALVSCEPDADALYASYGYGAVNYGYAAPLLRQAPIPVRRVIPAAPLVARRTLPAPTIAVRRTIAAPLIKSAPVAEVRTIAAPAVAEVKTVAAASPAAVNTVASSQYHSQDEDKNFSFGYSNINSARQESGNAYTGVQGSYSDGRRTINYVADKFGYRLI